MVNPGVELFCEREIPTTIDKVRRSGSLGRRDAG